MSRLLQRPDLAIGLAVALFAAAVLWMMLEISGNSATPNLAEPAAAAEVTPAEAAAAQQAQRGGTAVDKPAPAGRETPLVSLPANGTPVLKVSPGAEVALSAKPGGDAVVTLGDTTEFGSPTVLTVLERDGNWVGVPTEKLPNGELGWLKLEAGDKAYDVDSVDEAIVVDVSSMKAEFLRDGDVKRSWTVSVGAPATPTPTGHYSVTDTLDNTFSASYGCCVLPITATQPNLPAGWTGGNRMAIHGTTSALGLANSNGCVRNGESDMQFLMAQAPLGTPVTIKN